MSISKKLEIIYHNGQSDGIRLVRRNLSTMTAYIIPRPLLAEAKTLRGICRPGVYYLINENDYNKVTQIYVGQTRNGINRIEDHNRSKNFWNKAIMFLADDKTFTLDMISGLEKYAIQKAIESKQCAVENAVVPKYEIDEYDLASVEEVYEEIQFIMETQGFKMNNSSMIMNKTEMFHTTRKDVNAQGIYDGENFIVLERSEVTKQATASCPKSTLGQRETAIMNGDMIESNGKYYLTKSFSFSSPSAAAGFVLGASANGLTEWKNKNGKTLKEQLQGTR